MQPRSRSPGHRALSLVTKVLLELSPFVHSNSGCLGTANSNIKWAESLRSARARIFTIQSCQYLRTWPLPPLPARVEGVHPAGRWPLPCSSVRCPRGHLALPAVDRSGPCGFTHQSPGGCRANQEVSWLQSSWPVLCCLLRAPLPRQQQGPFSKPNDGSGACSADVRPEERFLRSIADCLRPGALALYAAAFPLTGPGHILMVCFHLSFGHSALLPETAICVAH